LGVRRERRREELLNRFDVGGASNSTCSFSAGIHRSQCNEGLRGKEGRWKRRANEEGKARTLSTRGSLSLLETKAR